jgi:hypothetical protein
MQRREMNGYRIPDPTVERIITKNRPDIQSFALGRGTAMDNCCAAD